METPGAPDLPTHRSKKGQGKSATNAEASEKTIGKFLEDFLTAECALGPAEAGVILRQAQDKKVGVLAAHPNLNGDRTPAWFGKAAERAQDIYDSDRTVILPWEDHKGLYGQSPSQHILIVPLRLVEIAPAATAFLIQAADRTTLRRIQNRLQQSISLLNLAEMRQTVQKKDQHLLHLQRSIKVLSAVNQHHRFGSTAMALCNEIASQWQCERASIGFLKRRYVHIKAMSHTEDFNRKMQIVQDLETVMEECLEQNQEIIYPPPPTPNFFCRSASELSKRYGPLAVVSLPIRHAEDVQAVLTLERPGERPFMEDEVTALRLTLELVCTRLLDLHRQDRWVGAKLIGGLRWCIALVVGAKHTWAKLASLLILAAILFLVFAKGMYRAEASFVFEATERQIVPAPFDGFIKEVHVEISDRIKANETPLAQLDTVELRLQLTSREAEESGYLKQADAAMRDGDMAQAQIAQANADRARAEVELLKHLIKQADIISPVSGAIVEGDLKRQIGAPIKTGDTLFEVTALNTLRAALYVPEDQIVDVVVGQEGRLATASFPSQPIAFSVERINPIAEVINQKNVFKVYAQLEEKPAWMRPGMEGIAKIDIDRRPYAWIWTRRIVNWIRMKLWW